jgi:hypothetical protein
MLVNIEFKSKDVKPDGVFARIYLSGGHERGERQPPL